MEPVTFVPLGRVARTHGLTGEVSVVPTGDLPVLLPEGIEVWFVPPPVAVRSGRIESVRPGPKGTLLKVSGVDDLGAASALVGTTVVCRPEDAPVRAAPAPGAPDPIGLEVTDVDRGSLGRVDDVIVTGANDVWVVRGGPLGEVLLPVIHEVVLETDFEARTARVRLLPGLLDED